jgi:DNA-binding NarL/FixJ family response regulator
MVCSSPPEVTMVRAIPPSLVIADAHRLFVAGLSKLLGSKFRIISTVGDGRSLVEAAQTLRPDLILTELAMPLMNGFEAIHRIRRAMPSMRIVCISSNSDDETIRECFQKGASGFIPKTASGAELVLGLRRVLHGDIYLSQRLPQSAKLFSDPVSTATTDDELPLTERQIEVLQLLAEGKTMKEVAAVLNLTTRTVAFHKYRLMNTLNLNTNAAVVQYALQHRVVFA